MKKFISLFILLEFILLSQTQAITKNLLHIHLLSISTEQRTNLPASVIYLIQETAQQNTRTNLYNIPATILNRPVVNFEPFDFIVRTSNLRSILLAVATDTVTEDATLFIFRYMDVRQIISEVNTYHYAVLGVRFFFRIIFSPISTSANYKSYTLQLIFLLNTPRAQPLPANSISSFTNLRLLADTDTDAFICMNDDYFTNNHLTYNVFALCCATEKFFRRDYTRIQMSFDLTIFVENVQRTTRIVLPVVMFKLGTETAQYNYSDTIFNVQTTFTEKNPSEGKFLNNQVENSDKTVLKNQKSFDIPYPELRLCPNGGYCQNRISSSYCDCLDIVTNSTCNPPVCIDCSNSSCIVQRPFNTICTNFNRRLPDRSSIDCRNFFKCENNGRCVLKSGEYECECALANFTGRFCEINCFEICGTNNCIKNNNSIDCLCFDGVNYVKCMPPQPIVRDPRPTIYGLFGFILAMSVAGIVVSVLFFRRYRHELIWNKPRNLRNTLRSRMYTSTNQNLTQKKSEERI